MGLDNDTRGWIMTCISGVACVLGASIICVDVFVRLFPGMHNFSISESDAFLSASLSLTFGVMLFSSLYSMLPQSKTLLIDGGYSPREASILLIGLFLAGAIGIKILSAFMHHFMPSHVVDCDHTHDDEVMKENQEEMSEHAHDDEHTTDLGTVRIRHEADEDGSEESPLLSRQTSYSPPKSRLSSAPVPAENGFVTAPSSRRPSLMPRSLTRSLTRYVSGRKDNCDETGPCMGFSDPCGQECFKAIHRRGSMITAQGEDLARPRIPTWNWRRLSHEVRPIAPVPESDEESGMNGDLDPPHTDARRDGTRSGTRTPRIQTRSRSATHHYHHPEHEHFDPVKVQRRDSSHSHSVGPEHHHHVPTNAFMSIGLQTSLAIALHKAPEGFITYATNHANPTLGFTVFMALFIHNITEGFALSLPLFLALNSRTKAIVWSSFLGGLSQPVGAGVAALWFKLAKRDSMGGLTEGAIVAVGSGVMTSVALSLFSESLQLSHNKGTCIAFAFLGMGILGFSFALTAKS